VISGSSKKPKIEIQDLKKCSVTELLTADSKSRRKSKRYEDGELSSSSEENVSSSKHTRREKGTSPRESKSSSSRIRDSRERSSRHE